MNEAAGYWSIRLGEADQIAAAIGNRWSRRKT
jgi:hypothetical protein